MGMCSDPETCPECQEWRKKHAESFKRLIGKEREDGLKNFGKSVDAVILADRKQREKEWRKQFQS